MVHNMAQKTQVCPLCGAVPWREKLQSLSLRPVDTHLLGENHEVSLCQDCLAELAKLPDSYRWGRFLELYYKRQQEIASQPKLSRKKTEKYGQKGR